jgi:hypothetical protein
MNHRIGLARLPGRRRLSRLLESRQKHLRRLGAGQSDPAVHDE